eukprot:SAG31_NODE_816_length_11865_cov_38.805116_14_plen_148_part_00
MIYSVAISLHGYGFLELLIKISTPQTDFRTFAKPLYHPRCLTIPAITLTNPSPEVRCIHVANNTAVYTETDYYTRFTYTQYQYLQSSTSSTRPEQYLAAPAADIPQLCTSTAQRHNVIGTTYQHNTDTTMGITITDNLVDTTLYRDH